MEQRIIELEPHREPLKESLMESICRHISHANEHKCAVKFEHDECKMLLTGDMDYADVFKQLTAKDHELHKGTPLDPWIRYDFQRESN